MNKETYIKKIGEASDRVDVLRDVLTVLENANDCTSKVYRMVLNELQDQQDAIVRWKKFINLSK